MCRPVILHHLVGVEDVAPDLVAPTGLDMLATDLARVGTLSATVAAAAVGVPALVYVIATLTSVISTA